jgi:hypothetical protein
MGIAYAKLDKFKEAIEAFKARSDNTYRVKIKATVDVTIFFGTFPLETEKFFQSQRGSGRKK